MRSSSYSTSFLSPESPENIFKTLIDVTKWWSGIYAETIKGKSGKVGDEFTFKAGGGAHYTKQKLVELVPEKKIVWVVEDSNLSFLEKTNEWDGTKIGFELSNDGELTKVTFSHDGLVPEMQGYGGCSDAWAKYMDNLRQKLNA